MPTWRAMQAGDAPAMVALAYAALGPAFAEAPGIYLERLALSPLGCLVCCEGDRVLGYAIAHPGRRGQPPALNSLLGGLHPAADCWYLHDTALDSALRGQGHAAAMLALQEAQARAHGFTCLALVAVAGAWRYWQRQGFTAAMSPTLAAKLASYGNDAVYMEKPLAG